MYFARCTNSVYLILCVLDPMYFSEGLCTEEPCAMLSGQDAGFDCSMDPAQARFSAVTSCGTVAATRNFLPGNGIAAQGPKNTMAVE